ncbi:flagellar associated [Micractinium conductrix]|uniref:Flagellar associated n=1 Tax=Micractinium conductrix TaxID=554055 RepID=A0A2P6V046_9CHLO|nr:flagellar associated [Micractinium conductrix]|eukprot:PSC67460.1 flagellar associated [Micractinium conductrix]
MSKAVGGVVALFSAAVIGFAITIIVLVAEELWPGSGYYDACFTDYSVEPPITTCGTYYSSGICLMTNNSVNICRYSYSAAGIGIFAAAVTLCAMCMPAAVSVVMSLFQAVWWLGYAITVTVYNDNVSNMEFTLDTPKGPLTRAFGLPGGHWRNIVIALAWTAFAVCALCVPLSFKAGNEDSEADAPREHEEEVKYKMPDAPAGSIGMPPPAAAVV